MNKEQLRLKLLEAWSKGYIKIDTDTPVEGDMFWGFLPDSLSGSNIQDFLGLSDGDFFSNPDFDVVSIAVSKEIVNSPLMLELA